MYQYILTAAVCVELCLTGAYCTTLSWCLPHILAAKDVAPASDLVLDALGQLHRLFSSECFPSMQGFQEPAPGDRNHPVLIENIG